MDQVYSLKNVFIIGCKGIPAAYGGFETFVDKLTQYNTDGMIKYHIACAVDSFNNIPVEFEYNLAHCYNIRFRKIGAARAVVYDLEALSWAIDYAKQNEICNPIFYILACRIGPFMNYYKKQIELIEGKLFVNPDGLEWRRSKWNFIIKKYWKFSERLMIKNSDLIVCDSKNIEEYICNTYRKYQPATTYISYGADIEKSTLSDQDPNILEWYKQFYVTPYHYYLIVGRFVPENNYEIMLNEFMKSQTKKDLVIITNTNEKYLNELKFKTHFQMDKRIKFVGTVYDQNILKKIRENAFAYIHGHEVGGTNPSLLESLSSTRLSLLLDVGFNNEVAKEGALYWNKDNNSLARLLDNTEKLSDGEINSINEFAKERIKKYYNWPYIVSQYKKILW